MLYNVFKVLISVRAKLFFGFFAMAVLVILLGGYSFLSLKSAENVVKDTYDRPLMAINYARSAAQVLSEVKIEAQEMRSAAEAGETPDKSNFDALRETFREDLAIARERSIAPRAEEFFQEIDRLRFEWQGVTQTNPVIGGDTLAKAEDLYDAIVENIDIIIELQTNESFRQREAAIAKMKKIETYSLWAMGAALALTAIFSIWIAVTIINPLRAAADAARKISAGNLDAEIPRGGVDETGVLLKTMYVMQKNIRERMNKETSQRALAHERLVDALENSADAIMLTDSHGNIIVANGALKTMFPIFQNTDLGGLPYLNYFDENGCPVTGAYTYHSDVCELGFADGRWAQVNASDNQEGGRLIIWTDITRAKLRENNLRDAKEKAEAANKSKTDFLATMSHELRTPLNAVIGFSNLIASEGLGDIENKKYLEMAGMISQSGEHLLHLVKDVLTIADGRNPYDLEYTMEPLDLNDVLEFCLVSIRKTAKEKGIRLISDERGSPIMIMGDRIRLQQMGINILSNAVKFNKPGGFIKATVGALSDKAVRIDIIDSGIGIKPEDIKRITEPFVQVDNGTTRQYEGVGLGLSIVQKWAAHHKGKLSIKSEYGKGTMVSIALPLMQAQDQIDSTSYLKAG